MQHEISKKIMWFKPNSVWTNKSVNLFEIASDIHSIYFDLETTGLDPLNDEIIQIAIGGYSHDKIQTFRTRTIYVKPSLNPTQWEQKMRLEFKEQYLTLTYETLRANIHDPQLFQPFLDAYLKGSEVFKEYYLNHFEQIPNECNLLIQQALQTKVHSNNEFLNHQLKIYQTAYNQGISINDAIVLLNRIFKNKFVITYNGIGFDNQFIKDKLDADYCVFDVLMLAKKLWHAKNNPWGLYVLNTTDTLTPWNEQPNEPLVNLKQDTLGSYLCAYNKDAHNAAGDIDQLATITNTILKNTFALHLQHLNMDPTNFPLLAFNSYDTYQRITKPTDQNLTRR